MYTKVIDIDLRQTDDISTSPTLTKTIRKDESQFTLLRLNLLPTYPLNLVLSDAKVFWSYNDTNINNGEISNGYVMTHLPIEIAKQLNSASDYQPTANFVMMSVIGYVGTSEVNFGSYVINVYSYKGFDNVPENPELNVYPDINVTPNISYGETPGPGPGPEPGPEPITNVCIVYSNNKETVEATEDNDSNPYAYVGITSDTDATNNISWFVNPKIIGKASKAITIWSQNSLCTDWLPYGNVSTVGGKLGGHSNGSGPLVCLDGLTGFTPSTIAFSSTGRKIAILVDVTTDVSCDITVDFGIGELRLLDTKGGRTGKVITKSEGESKLCLYVYTIVATVVTINHAYVLDLPTLYDTIPDDAITDILNSAIWRLNI